MDNTNKDDAPWYLKYGARGVGCGGGLISMIIGLFNCITLTAWCLVGGIYLMFAGFIIVSAEAPCCCMFIDFVQSYSSFVENRPHYQKAALYIFLALPGVIMCPTSISMIFGSLLIFLCGVLYGMMALGKKGSRAEMMTAAQATAPVSAGNIKSTLVNMEVPPATS